MADILATIMEAKRDEVTALKSRYSPSDLDAMATAASAPRGFTDALIAASHKGYGLIAELKKASPSKGLIRADFSPAPLAKAYEEGGATCLSVLTDERWFQGSDDYLVAARSAVSLPCLRKDFMVDPAQIIHSRGLGADCILLIMAGLDDGQAAELEATALSLGMDVLIETHNAAEIERAARLRSPLIGVNNRNLKTMDISLDVGKAMLPLLPQGRIAVAESGLFSADDLADMASAGARCFLIGESLMRQQDVATATAHILANPVQKAASS